MKILIKNCNLICVSDKRDKYEENIDILIEDDRIKKIERNIETENCKKIIDAKGKIVMPGLINAHTHVPMSIFRDTLDGYLLQEWLNDKIWPMEDKLTEEDVYYASLLSCIEMIKSGTTTFNDQYFMTDAIIKAAIKTGIRAHTTRTIADITGDVDKRLEELEEIINKYNNQNNVIINVGVHGLYTCSKECIQKAVELAKKYNLYIHMHFAENSKELEDIKRMHNTNSPIDLLKEYFKGTDIILAHCVKIDKNKVAKLKEINASVVHCPTSNLKLGCGIAPINDYLENGINVALGTDGQGSGNNLNLFKEMSCTALLQKGINENPKLLPAYEIIKMATINGAKALNQEKEIGSIEENKKADLIILDLEKASTQPVNDVFSNIVYNVTPNNIETTIINGKIVMDKGIFEGINEKTIYNKCTEIIDRISR